MQVLCVHKVHQLIEFGECLVELHNHKFYSQFMQKKNYIPMFFPVCFCIKKYFLILSSLHVDGKYVQGILYSPKTFTISLIT